MDLLKIVFYALVLISLVLKINSEPVSCISCVWSSSFTSTPGDHCYRNPANTTTVRCANERFYCQTLLVYYQGGKTVIQRGCADPLDDIHKLTSETPQHTRCEVKRNPSNNRLEARCYYACKRNNCNNVTLGRVRLCPDDCFAKNGGGYCNYKTGVCMCRAGRVGPNCRLASQPPKAIRKCVQCNGKLDRSCEQATLATQCSADIETYKYCTTTRTTVFDKDQNQVDSFISRGCSATFNHADQCQFAPHTARGQNTGAIEYTCSSTCDYNGCNTNLPDGDVRTGERKDLYCVVCESDDDSSECSVGNMARTRCPSGTRFCKSSVTYYISDNKDLNYEAQPAYKFIKIIRKCAGHYIDSGCREQALGNFLGKKVRCEQTCNVDGCNTGWPNRPLCSQCTSNVNQNRFDSCWSSPNWPSQCAKPYEGFCVTINRKVKSRRSHFIFKREIERKCSYHDIGQACRNNSFGGVEIETCNSTCTESACNFNGLRSTNLGNISFSRTSSYFIFGLSLVFQFFIDYF